MVDHNQRTLRTRKFKGFLQFQKPGTATYYRLKERQELSVTLNFLREEHYSDDGVKSLDPSGYRHTFSTTLKLTSDLIDDVYSGSSDTETLSYWIYKSAANGDNIGDLDPVEIVFVATMEALSGPSGSTTQKYIHWKFTLDPETYSFGFNPNSGTDEVTISGEVTSITSVTRSASATPP